MTVKNGEKLCSAREKLAFFQHVINVGQIDPGIRGHTVRGDFPQ